MHMQNPVYDKCAPYNPYNEQKYFATKHMHVKDRKKGKSGIMAIKM